MLQAGFKKIILKEMKVGLKSSIAEATGETRLVSIIRLLDRAAGYKHIL